MHLCDLSHTNPLRVLWWVCARAEGAEGVWIHVNSRAHSGATGNLLWYPECHHCHCPHHHLFGAGGSQMLWEVLQQHSDRSSVFSYVPVSWLCPPKQSSAAGTGFPPLLGCRPCGSKASPKSSLLHPAPSVQHWRGRACPSPYSSCCCCCREKRCCQSLRPGRAPLASLQLHLKAVGPRGFGGVCGGMAEQQAPSGGWHAKSP